MSRRKKAALVISMGLALGIALVITVNSVSAGMQDAQGKVLQSLYGLGTDMTVTKAAAAPSANSTDRPRLDFDAQQNGSSKTQSSDNVRVRGFQSLASSVVTKVNDQKNVADAVGAISLQVTKVSGQFTQDGTGVRDAVRGPTGSCTPTWPSARPCRPSATRWTRRPPPGRRSPSPAAGRPPGAAIPRGRQATAGKSPGQPGFCTPPGVVTYRHRNPRVSCRRYGVARARTIADQEGQPRVQHRAQHLRRPGGHAADLDSVRSSSVERMFWLRRD